MLESFGDWIVKLAAAAVIGSIAVALTPAGTVKRAVRLAAGLLSAAALLSFGVNIDTAAFTESLAKYRAEGESIIGSAETEMNEITKSVIREKCESYILDKGRSQGIDIQKAVVSLRWSEEGYWYPVSCEITGGFMEETAKSLAVSIEAELGIPQSAQIWRIEDES